jgi:chorismate dehydratase
MKPTARIGMVNFINTAPLYEVWLETVRRPEWRVTEGTPALLNRLLHAGELDLGFVSSHEYALHPREYRILGDLSISATGPVGSVLLLSRLPFTELSGKTVLLSAQSQTSVSLIRILLEEFCQVRPNYRVGQAMAGEEGAVAAVLAIGDEALRLSREREAFPHVLDLSQAWQEHTGLPFVFAVWAVREEFCRQEPDTVWAVHQELLRCIARGREELAAISARVAGRIPMDPAQCHRYLQGVEYDLSEEKQESLRKFFACLIKRGEVPATALPLRICGAT